MNYVDPTGEVIQIDKDASPKFKKKYNETIAFMKERKTYYNLEKLQKSKIVYTIKESTTSNTCFDSSSKTIFWGPNHGFKNVKTGIAFSPATVLAHEASHAARYDLLLNQGREEEFLEDNKYGTDKQFDTKEERRAIQTDEQIAAQRHGEITENQVTRNDHRAIVFGFYEDMSPKDISETISKNNKEKNK